MGRCSSNIQVKALVKKQLRLTVIAMASLAERKRIARLVHRFGFGPRPGEFTNLLAGGFDQAAEKYLNVPSQDAFADNQDEPMVRDQGKRPAPNSPDFVS